MKDPKPAKLESQVSLSEWAGLRSHLAWAYDGPPEPSARNPSKFAFDHMAAWFLRRGEVQVRMAGTSWQARAGEWLIPPLGEREQHFSADARLVSLRFRVTWPTGENLFDGKQGLKLSGAKYPALLRSATPLLRFVKQHFPSTTIDLMQEAAPLSVHLRLQTIFARWLETFFNILTEIDCRPSRLGMIDHRLVAAVHQLDHRPLAEPIAEAALAASVKISVSQLNRLFLQQFGFTPYAYFDRRRYQYALALVENSPKTVKEIAYNLGFSSLAHFSAWFKHRHGFPPTVCRENAGQGAGLQAQIV